jgi:hypothetical protein
MSRQPHWLAEAEILGTSDALQDCEPFVQRDADDEYGIFSIRPSHVSAVSTKLVAIFHAMNGLISLIACSR